MKCIGEMCSVEHCGERQLNAFAGRSMHLAPHDMILQTFRLFVRLILRRKENRGKGGQGKHSYRFAFFTTFTVRWLFCVVLLSIAIRRRVENVKRCILVNRVTLMCIFPVTLARAAKLLFLFSVWLLTIGWCNLAHVYTWFRFQLVNANRLSLYLIKPITSAENYSQ